MKTLSVFGFGPAYAAEYTHMHMHLTCNSPMQCTTPLLATISHECLRSNTHNYNNPAIKTPCATQRLHNRERIAATSSTTQPGRSCVPLSFENNGTYELPGWEVDD